MTLDFVTLLKGRFYMCGHRTKTLGGFQVIGGDHVDKMENDLKHAVLLDTLRAVGNQVV